ncbi:TetR/AcrR family transcriptional regulator [Salipiger sp. PrR002]|uniref:TetR/AcrR family transcriptional regulator n=1 Tax=Salipiger sp. PrR002 TaxID=2706489 RepID=UPI0013BD002F|nr:TetR/AcrR family transcriptional regulator [Salipiger sp. PrR002]NDW00116.1 TetR/AcrR family transcriptional regulator [Salipiger sp. PrR002]NDW56875.1 TetR/AcrR family transcriptional regulator [Salipiger sp. PrR004]
MTSEGKTNERTGAAPRKGRPKAADDAERRKHLIEVTTALFLEHGYQGVTMSKIAAAAHVSLNTVYRLFPGKPDLFAALVGEHRRSMVDLPGDYDDLPIAEALERIFFVNLDKAAEQRRFGLAQMLVTEAERSAELGEVFLGEGPAYTHKLLVDWLTRQHDLGRIAIEDAGTAAKMLMDIAFGAPGSHRKGALMWEGMQERNAHLKICFAIVARGMAV